MNLLITRNSVCSADDLMAPHEKRIRNIEKKCIREVLEEIRDQYLPKNISGGSVWLIKQKVIDIGVIEFPSKIIIYFINPESIVFEAFRKNTELKAECTEYTDAKKYISEKKKEIFINGR